SVGAVLERASVGAAPGQHARRAPRASARRPRSRCFTAVTGTPQRATLADVTPRALSLLRWGALALVALIVVIVLALAFAGGPLKHPSDRLASRKLGVPVPIDGALHTPLVSFTPAITAESVALGNPPWESRATLGTVERVHVEVKLLALLLRGHLVLERL